jgi:hypothetical protein
MGRPSRKVVGIKKRSGGITEIEEFTKSGKNETSTVDVHENKGSYDIITEKKSGF